MSDFGGRQPNAVLSAFAVLEEVARAGPGITAQQISANLGLPRATAYRLLNLLVQDEYLVRLPDLTGFALGRKVALLAGLSTEHDTTREVESVLDALRSRIRGGVHLARLDEGRPRFVDVDPDFPLSDPARIGDDLAASALGRLVLAEREQRAGVTPVPYAVQIGTLTPGFGCLALAVRDPEGRLLAGLALALPAARLGSPAELADGVRADVERLATLMSPGSR
ncbi:MAG: helix-turn-helix domain-containing protein [Nocardioides sp.]|uniref:helix-turn-helix domain-containing protein n=1 Tax=Nocardioides sp. TaxID=35761 RepID=UPI0039E2E717